MHPLYRNTIFFVSATIALSSPVSQAQQYNGVGLKVLGTRPPDTQPIAGQPLETRPPQGIGQQPAFPGQTRAVAVISKTLWQAQIVAHGLNQPWSFAFLPDGKILVLEKVGSMRLVDSATGKIEEDLRDRPALGGPISVVCNELREVFYERDKEFDVGDGVNLMIWVSK